MSKSSNKKQALSRKAKIYNELQSLTRALCLKGFNSDKEIGFNAEYIGNKVGVSRNNTSKELNRLLREGKVLKIRGRPVLYLDKQLIEGYFAISIKNPTFSDFKDFMQTVNNCSDESDTNSKKDVYPVSSVKGSTGALDSLVGADGSLKAQVEQAKAAILYPPFGLHTLISGPTGVGKTTFAEAMYRFALETGRLPQDAPFIVFNCADYAENPQLILSHLFGHIKGAFTGAGRTKEGLVSHANGGILFLDEAHRLPPEGQEMLFLLMDKGIYRMMGEAANTRKARVLIIAATSEAPESVMLDTFLRRIPVLIKLPTLNERSLRERMNLICQFFQEESERVKVSIKVSKEVLKAFLLYDCPNNIGQLKSDIQLICAKAFLDYITYKDELMEIRLSQLSHQVREGLFKTEGKRKEIIQIFSLLETDSILFDGKNPGGAGGLFNRILVDDYKMAVDFYDLIEKSWKRYSKAGLSGKQIREKIDKNIKNYFQNFSVRLNSTSNVPANRLIISNIIDQSILQKVEDTLSELSADFDFLFNRKIVYSLALHIETLIERLKRGTVISHPDRKSIKKEHPEEYQLALKIMHSLENKLLIPIPEDEAAFLAMFLYAVRTGKDSGNIGVLVIAHGPAVASGMAHVANKLLGVDHAHAVDMPLELSVEDALEKTIEEIKRLNTGKGVLMLVDMGSLKAFGEIATEKTGIPTKVIEMVSTPMVIEATRKAIVPGMDLETLEEDVKNISPFIGQSVDSEELKIYSEGSGKRFFERMLIDTLGKTLTFLNPEKAFDTLKYTLERILEDIGEDLNDDMLVKFTFHCSCMIERVLVHEPLPYKNIELVEMHNRILLNILKKHFTLAGEVFGVTIPDTEIAYVAKIFDTHLDTQL